MSAPMSYPFRHIAEKYGLDYSEVLLKADEYRRTGKAEFWELNSIYACVDIIAACDEFAAIQRGEIDWLTGLQPASTFNREG